MRRDESEWWSRGYTAEWWLGLDQQQRAAFLAALDPIEIEQFFRDWRIWAHTYQIPPESDWDTWLFLAGRGSGKTRSAVEYIDDKVETSLQRLRIAIVGQGEDDIREVMVEGESGFLACAKPWNRPEFKPSVGGGRLIWPSGSTATIYSAADTEALRGPQFHFGWFDEPMAVPRAQRQRALDNLEFCLRLGDHPQLILTTTPKKDPWLKEMLQKAKDPDNKIHVSRATTHDNAINLADNFLRKIVRHYGGTKLGRQEIGGELLGDDENALWTQDVLDDYRLPTEDPIDVADTCDKVVVSIDPNTKNKVKMSHAAGIVVVGRRGRERFVLADRTTTGGPSSWGKAAVLAAREFDADEVVAEAQHGGEMVKIVILQAMGEIGHKIPIHLNYTKKDKAGRAEPCATLYQRGVVHHVGPQEKMDDLETQMLYLHEGEDPTGEDFDRCDALVWGLTRLGLKRSFGSSAGSKRAVGILTTGDFVANAQSVES